jgi:predicted nucleotidyltransferase
MKALIIRDPWIGLILAGRKTWELRTSATKVRGRIGLIRKGTGLIMGVADLVDSLPPLSADALATSRDQHAVPPEMDSVALAAGWLHPWVLHNAQPLEGPVPAGQKSGQVIWVSLAPEIEAKIRAQLPPEAESTARNDIEPTAAGVIFKDRSALTALCGRHRIRRLALFGSTLKGTARPDSDIDLLVEFEPGGEPGLLGLAQIEAELGALLDGNRRVDLRTPNDLSQFFRQDVVNSAAVQYAA